MNSCPTKVWINLFLVWIPKKSTCEFSWFRISLLWTFLFCQKKISYLFLFLFKQDTKITWVLNIQIKQEVSYWTGLSVSTLSGELLGAFSIFIKILDCGLYIEIWKQVMYYLIMRWTQRFLILAWPEFLMETKMK